MAIPRASCGMLRSQIRPASRSSAPHHLRGAAQQQVRTKIQGPDDLGGPGGQEPRPSKPAGPDTMKRNWYDSAEAPLQESSTISLESIEEDEDDVAAEEAGRCRASSSSSDTSDMSTTSAPSSNCDPSSSSSFSTEPLFEQEYVSFPKLTTPSP